MDLIGLLLTLIVFLVIVYCIKIAADWCEVPAPIRNIVLIICFLVFMVYILRDMGVARF